MNKARRKQIGKILEKLSEVKALIEGCRDEEQDYKDNMPENLQSGDKGTAADSAIDALDNAASSCDDVSSSLEEAQA